MKPGYGTINNPLDITDISWYKILPGHTVYLRGGTYTTNLLPTLVGTAENPIIIKPYNNERVIIDGTHALNSCAYTYWYDIEFMVSTWTNRTEQTTINDMNVGAIGCKLINCNIHDVYNFGFWDNAIELYGCIIWNNGIDAVDDFYGHSLYTQHVDSINRKQIKHNIINKSMNFNLHTYSQVLPSHGFDFIQNVLFQGRNLIGGTNNDYDILFDGNCTYNTRLQIGYTDDYTECVLTNNYLMNKLDGALLWSKWEDLTLEDNIFVSGITGGTQRNLVTFYQSDTPGDQEWNDNTYYNLSGKTEPFHLEGIDTYTFTEWKALFGYDADSTITTDAPADTHFLWANTYAADSKRKGLLVIYNHSGANSVNIDLSSLGLSNGTYKLIQANDPLIDITTFSYTGAAISVNMLAAAHSIALPIAYGSAIISQTFPTFGAFMIEDV